MREHTDISIRGANCRSSLLSLRQLQKELSTERKTIQRNMRKIDAQKGDVAKICVNITSLPLV